MNGGDAVNLRARRRTDHPVRLTAGLTRGRGADRQARGHTRFTKLESSARSRALTDDLGRRAATEVAAPPATGHPGSGRLAGRWVSDGAGRLVMVWSLEPAVEAAPVIRLTRRKLEPDEPSPAPGSAHR